MNRVAGEKNGIKDLDWVWVESHNGKIRAQIKLMEGTNENTVWTWNAIGKRAGAWGLSDDANEAKEGFLMNHLISELLPPKGDHNDTVTNSDPVTGQAAWYDLRVKITPVTDGSTGSWPQFAPIKAQPNAQPSPKMLSFATHKNVNIVRSWADTLFTGAKHNKKDKQEGQ